MKGIKTDELEKLYATLDNDFGRYFELVRNGLSSDELLSEAGAKTLKLFLSYQFWRLPLLDGFADEYVKNLDLTQFGRRMTVNGVNIGDVDFFTQLIREDRDFRYYFRCFFLPLLTFDIENNGHDCWRVYDVAPEKSGWENLLCSDSPIVADDIHSFFRFGGRFIFPLTKSRLLVANENRTRPKSLDPVFSTKLSMLGFGQAQRYIAGTSTDYLSQVVALYGRYRKLYGSETISQLRTELFSQLDS